MRSAIDLGVSRSRLRARDLERPWIGVRSIRPPTSTEDRAAALLTRLPRHAVVSHSTAALLWGMPLPTRLSNASDIHVTYPRGRRAPDADGVVGHQRRIDEPDVDVVRAIPVTSRERTWCDLAPLLSLPDLVAVGDHLIAGRNPQTEVAELLRAVDRRVERRGVAQLRQALALLDPGSESRPETLLRLACTVADLPPLIANVDLRDARGRFVARPDLRFRDWPLALEYDGEQHRTDARQWRRDVIRLSAIEDLGIGVIRATADDLPDFERVVATARRRLRAFGWTG